MRDAGGYAVTVSNGINSVASRTAQLTVDFGTGNPYLLLILGARQDYHFKSGMSYYVVSPIQLYGDTVLSGGSVIKFDSSYADARLVVMGALTCDTQPYYPAILTSVDDDSVGFPLGSGSPPQPYANAAAYLDLSSATSSKINNLRIAYANQGVTTPLASRRLDVWDCQFLDCNFAIVNLVPGVGALDSLHNVLFAYCGAAVGAVSNLVAIEAEQVTADVYTFCEAAAPAYKLALTNCLVSGSLGNATTTYTPHTVINPSTTNFQTANAGNYYLTAQSSYHKTGTTNISPALLAELKHKTTCAPIVFPAFQTIAGELTLLPQAPRYTNGPPDLGYYYAPLDYTFGWLRSFGRITVEPGTVIGMRNEYSPKHHHYTWFGFDLREGSTFTSHGTPQQPNTFTDVQLVQEQFEYPSLASFVPDFFPSTDNAPPPALDFRFSNFYILDSRLHFWSGYDWYADYVPSPDSLVNWNLQDCQFHGGRICLGTPDDGTVFGAPPDFIYGAGAITWRNNLFDGVSLELNPTFYWTPFAAINCDLSFQANNNLFRGGNWFILVPIPATAGNGTFQDNLFEKLDLLQDTNSPLDYAYNGYWPKTASELLWSGRDIGRLLPTATSGTTNGLHEVTFPTAPPYQVGPLGNYYLPNSTPLYHAGSQTPGEAGLYHYTTRLDQIKEGDEYIAFNNQVNIGLHYVAVTNNQLSTGNYQPKDSDGDGIPDYMEDANGSGTVEAGVETDWHNQYTDTGVFDPTNSIYDDIDLSGNGLVGRIKKALGLSPFDPNNPLTVKQVITGEEPDIATFEVPVSYSTLTNIGIAKFWLDGEAGAEFQSFKQNPTNGLTLLVWKTLFDPPGQHVLQPRLYLKTADFSTVIQPVTTAVGPLLSFQTTNALQFDPFYLNYDHNGATLFARTYSGTTYSIELRDPNGSHLKTITGTVAAGATEINEAWDLIEDDIGHTAYTGNSFTAAFTVTPPSLPTQTHTVELNVVTMGFGDGDFAVSFCWPAFSGPNQSVRRCIQQGVVNPLISPDTASTINPHPYPHTFNDFSSVSPYSPGNPGFISNDSEKTALLANLDFAQGQSGNHTRNFYWYGHGTPLTIGGDAPLPILEAPVVATALGNVLGHVVHPYRLVFLDACETATDTLWAQAFGIPKTLTYQQLSSHPEKAQAFLGWKTVTAGMNTDQKAQDKQDTLNFFFSLWQSNRYPLEECYQACSKLGNPGPQYDPSGLVNIKFPLGALHNIENDGVIPWPASKVIYGCPRITRLGIKQ